MSAEPDEHDAMCSAALRAYEARYSASANYVMLLDIYRSVDRRLR